MRQRLVRHGPVIDVYMNDKLSNVKLPAERPNDIRQFIIGSVPEGEIDDLIKKLLGPEGEIEFDVNA